MQLLTLFSVGGVLSSQLEVWSAPPAALPSRYAYVDLPAAHGPVSNAVSANFDGMIGIVGGMCVQSVSVRRSASAGCRVCVCARVYACLRKCIFCVR